VNGKYLFDTNIIIALFKSEEAITNKLKNRIEIYIPSIAIGELFYGAYKSIKVAENKKRINDFVTSINCLQVTDNTADFYGSIKNQLKKAGTPIPENDIWIAAIAQENNLTLVTRDAHMEKVDNISIEFW